MRCVMKRRKVVTGLAGLGDLVVTCFSRHSRNRAFGERVGRGETSTEALGHSTMVVEGVKTTASARSRRAPTGGRGWCAAWRAEVQRRSGGRS